MLKKFKKDMKKVYDNIPLVMANAAINIANSKALERMESYIFEDKVKPPKSIKEKDKRVCMCDTPIEGSIIGTTIYCAVCQGVVISSLAASESEPKK